MSRRVLVTGGGRGVGAAIVTALAEAGFEVDFTYRSASTEADALRSDLARRFPRSDIAARQLDLGDREAIEAFCAELDDRSYYGFVHNAGQPYDTLAATMAQDRAEAIMQVNFWALTRLAKSVMRPMIRARTGRIVAIGSVAALVGSSGNAAYAATKGALLAYCRTLAIETAKRGVTVNVVAPGFVDTDMLAPYAAHRAGIEKQIPLGRFAKPVEIAGLVAFLMSDPAAAITGTILPVDGGLTAMLGVHR